MTPPRHNATTIVEIASSLAELGADVRGYIRRSEEREKVASEQRQDMRADITKLQGEMVELTAIRNKGVGVLLALGVIAGIIGSKIGTLMVGIGEVFK